MNVASKCGFTPQYAALEALHEKYSAQGLTVVGVPCNQFGGQEPGTAEEIAEFCSTTYGVTFPLTEKVEVNGAGRHPLYAGLVDVADEKGRSGDVAWNFEKFLLDSDGTVVGRWSTGVEPDDPGSSRPSRRSSPAESVVLDLRHVGPAEFRVHPVLDVRSLGR